MASRITKKGRCSMKRINGEQDVEMMRVDGRFVAVEKVRKGGVVRFLLHTVAKGAIMVAIIYLTLKLAGVM